MVRPLRMSSLLVAAFALLPGLAGCGGMPAGDTTSPPGGDEVAPTVAPLYIKDVENQMKNGGQTQCPGGGQQPGPGTNQPSSPQQDSQIQTNSGPGVVDPKKLQNLAQNWGKLPEKERAKAMMELTKDLPPRYREIIENYAKSIARGQK